MGTRSASTSDPDCATVVHLIDGTYELYRHFYGQRTFNQGEDRPFAALAGVLQSVLEILEKGENHVGVATDHVIEWPGHKTAEGIEPALWAQFHPLEEGLSAMGVTVWPMTELEADDALASAAHLAATDPQVQKGSVPSALGTPPRRFGPSASSRVRLTAPIPARAT